MAKSKPYLSSINRLIIIPDAPLNNLSFDALLVTSSPGNIVKQVDAEHFLVFKYAISYCFSANLLWEMHRHQVPAKLERKVAAFVSDPRLMGEVKSFEKNGLGKIF